MRVRGGRNLIYAKVLEVLNDGFRVCSIAKNKEFHVTPRVGSNSTGMRNNQPARNRKEILEAILERQLWTPSNSKTPEQSIYGSIFREINNKAHPRIVKSNVKGKFVIAV